MSYVSYIWHMDFSVSLSLYRQFLTSKWLVYIELCYLQLFIIITYYFKTYTILFWYGIRNLHMTLKVWNMSYRMMVTFFFVVGKKGKQRSKGKTPELTKLSQSLHSGKTDRTFRRKKTSAWKTQRISWKNSNARNLTGKRNKRSYFFLEDQIFLVSGRNWGIISCLTSLRQSEKDFLIFELCANLLS